MPNGFNKFFILAIAMSLFVTGCATTRPRRPDPKVEQQNQMAQMQSDLKSKDEEIQELKAKVETYEQALQESTASYSSRSREASGGTYSKNKSSIIRVSGVSVEEVQRALVRAGFDPGPVDGQAGRKTKSAIREFQRRNNLNADGIVGEKTWSRLK